MRLKLAFCALALASCGSREATPERVEQARQGAEARWRLLGGDGAVRITEHWPARGGSILCGHLQAGATPRLVVFLHSFDGPIPQSDAQTLVQPYALPGTRPGDEEAFDAAWQGICL